MSRGLTFLSEMTDHSGPGPAEPITGEHERQAEPAVVRGTDLRQQLRWVPLTAGLTALIIGLGYIAEGLLPGLYHRRLRGLSDLAPGTLANLTRTSDVIIGLLLLMLSHGLRRRKRRAWAAVMALLAVGLVIHAGLGIVLHHLQPDIPLPHAPPARGGDLGRVADRAVLPTGGSSTPSATGGPGGGRCGSWAALVVADVVLGLIALAVIGGLSANYTFGPRLYSVVANLVGFSGPVRFITEERTDHFGFLTGRSRPVHPDCRPVHVPAPGRAGRPAHARRRQPHPGSARAAWRAGLARLLHAAHDKSIMWSPTGKACIGYRVLSGVMLASGDPIGDPEAWPGAIHTFLDEAARHAWVPAVIGCGELGAEVWCREGNLNALELGDEAVVERGRLHPAGPGDAQRPADGQPGLPAGLHGRDPPGRRTSRKPR